MVRSTKRGSARCHANLSVAPSLEEINFTVPERKDNTQMVIVVVK